MMLRDLLAEAFEEVENVEDEKVDVEDLETSLGIVRHVRIKGHGKKNMSWESLQAIKDEIAGDSAVAIEVFPNKDNVVNQHNVRHLWVLPANFKLPFGLRATDNSVESYGDK